MDSVFDSGWMGRRVVKASTLRVTGLRTTVGSSENRDGREGIGRT